MELAVRLAVGALLLAAAAGKLRVRGELPALLGAYGLPRSTTRPLAVALVAGELVIGILLLAGIAADAAAVAALALGVVFTAAVASARLRGLRRLRCGCFGTKERSTSFLLVRALAFTALAGAAVFGGGWEPAAPSGDTLMVAGLAVLALAVAVLTALVLALYRQVGVLTLRIGPRSALELADEGPPVGRPAPPLAGLGRHGAELVAFFSENCRLCSELTPAVHALAREGVQVRVVYEHEEPAAFGRWNVPGTPFAVHVADGVVAAKGLVNTLEELDGLIAIGRARRSDAAA